MTTRDIQLAIHPESPEADAPAHARTSSQVHASADPVRPSALKEPKLSTLRARLAAQEAASQPSQQVAHPSAVSVPSGQGAERHPVGPATDSSR
ncbi:hypothetical protein ACVBEH_07235 [Roseateles sp. GG27B]